MKTASFVMPAAARTSLLPAAALNRMKEKGEDLGDAGKRCLVFMP